MSALKLGLLVSSTPQAEEAGREVRELAQFVDPREADVLVATDGNQALETIRREQPALVLLDVMMPGKTGFEVCQAVRADPALEGVRILMLTAKGRDTDISKGLALGANAYMTKPFSTRELVQKVAEMLGGAA